MNKKKLTRLKSLYQAAIERGDGSFMFEGGEILVNYAKYWIEYLEGKV